MTGRVIKFIIAVALVIATIFAFKGGMTWTGIIALVLAVIALIGALAPAKKAKKSK